MQLRGDIHPPEVEQENMAMNFDDEGEPRQFDDANLHVADAPQQRAFVVLAIPEETRGQKVRALARRQVAMRPGLMALGAFVLGVVAMRMLKRGANAL
jgi:hypothetical protein